mgnify:FL=1
MLICLAVSRFNRCIGFMCVWEGYAYVWVGVREWVWVCVRMGVQEKFDTYLKTEHFVMLYLKLNFNTWSIRLLF